MTIHFNGDIVQIIHIPDGHSDSDAIMYFHKANVVHMGDLNLSNRFPIIDIFYDSSVDG